MTQRAFAWFLHTLTASRNPATAGPRPGVSRGGWLARHVRAWRRARVRRRTIRELQALSDQQLKDIGVPRHMIVEVAARMARRHEEETARRRHPRQAAAGEERRGDTAVGACASC